MNTDSLFEQLKNPNPNLRQRAMVQLAENYDENTISRLMGILGDEDVTYRRAAVKALGFIGTDSVPSLVDSLLNSDNGTIKASCAKGLAQVAFNHPQAPFPTEGLEGLKTALRDPDAVVYIASVMALGEIGSPALDILVEALNSEKDNFALGVAIVNAIGSMGDRRGLEVLTSLSNDESADSYVRESAKSALSRLEQVIGYKEANAQRAQGNA